MKLKLAINNRNQIIAILGGLALLFVVLGSWLPTSCPVVRKWLASCPTSSGPLSFPRTNSEREIKRIPHQAVYSDRLEVSVKSEEKRNKTRVYFQHLDTAGGVVSMLQLQNADGTFKDLSLITHRGLINLSWPTIVTSDARLFQKEPTYETIDQLITSLPAKEKLGADAAAAALYNLQPDQYTPIEKLITVDNFDYVLTTFTPGTGMDGLWRGFEHSYDFSTVSLNDTGEYTLIIRIIQGYSIDDAFRVSTVHVDYGKSNQ